MKSPKKIVFHRSFCLRYLGVWIRPTLYLQDHDEPSLGLKIWFETRILKIKFILLTYWWILSLVFLRLKRSLFTYSNNLIRKVVLHAKEIFEPTQWLEANTPNNVEKLFKLAVGSNDVICVNMNRMDDLNVKFSNSVYAFAP